VAAGLSIMQSAYTINSIFWKRYVCTIIQKL
jgi:hypothetical protein